MIFLSFIFFEKINSEPALDVCKNEELSWCINEVNSWPTSEVKLTAMSCIGQLNEALGYCAQGSDQITLASGTSQATAATTTTSTVRNSDVGTGTTGQFLKQAGTNFTLCGDTAKKAAATCNKTGIVACMNYQSRLSTTCPRLAANAGNSAFNADLLKTAATALAAGGLGYFLGKRGKKGGGGGDNNPEVKKDEDDNKLKDLVMNSSSSSSAGPNIVYVDKPTPNNNGALGNPAVTDSSTTSRPTDAVTVAAITPSSSFGSDQKSLSTGSDPAPLSRTLSGSTGNTSLGGASGDSMNGSSPESADDGIANGTLVDGSSKGSGGGTGFMGGMDGSGGSGNGQGNSADGTMLTGVLSGVSNDPKKKSLLNKSKNQKTALPAQQQSKASLSASSTKRRVANANRQSTQAVKSETLVEFMTRKNLIRNTPKQLQK